MGVASADASDSCRPAQSQVRVNTAFISDRLARPQKGVGGHTYLATIIGSEDD